ncbi:DUF1415 domain-containing protein [Paraglaciecola sp.]|uniref:DUF1415 domain-containing protein n=1 Tax=Paraglaciecola sp. TaxID=1920173 RepID=UPI0027401CEB|nr:DUF1415 domain-containing protein [Paraglaciecola sp.]MDP5028944.1 DUF1415 domain-containing protein [Paraglaciecola sp.]
MSSQAQQKAIVARTQHWLEKVVIGLNFCPFAKREYDRQRIRYVIDSANSPTEALASLIDELSLLDANHEVETTLIIYDNAFGKFDDYLDLLELATSLVEQSAYRGIYQVASFHPEYCFEGEELSDPANFTNRSPFPMLHLLRESSLESVLSHFPHPELIPQRNIDKARELGLNYLQNLML